MVSPFFNLMSVPVCVLPPLVPYGLMTFPLAGETNSPSKGCISVWHVSDKGRLFPLAVRMDNDIEHVAVTMILYKCMEILLCWEAKLEKLMLRFKSVCFEHSQKMLKFAAFL